MGAKGEGEGRRARSSPFTVSHGRLNRAVVLHEQPIVSLFLVNFSDKHLEGNFDLRWCADRMALDFREASEPSRVAVDIEVGIFKRDANLVELRENGFPAFANIVVPDQDAANRPAERMNSAHVRGFGIDLIELIQISRCQSFIKSLIRGADFRQRIFGR